MPFMRGARPTPRHKLLAARPHNIIKAPPPQFAGLATQLSFWLNDQIGDCVSAEEAEAKGSWSAGYCGLPDLFIPDDVLSQWVNQHGFANGADLSDVMDAMIKDGITVSGTKYTDGSYSGVDYSNWDVLTSAIATGPVKIAIDANALPSGAGNGSGWYSFGKGNFPNTDHCVGLRGYGTAGYCFQAIGAPVPAGVDPNKPNCLILYTWKSYGVVDMDWVQGTCTEAWVRNPTTPGESPAPAPAPSPTPTPVPPAPSPTPTPPANWLARLIAFLESLFGPLTVKSGYFASRPVRGSAPLTLTWGGILTWLETMLVTYGPLIVPELEAWVNALPVSAFIKSALLAVIQLLVNQLPPAPTPAPPAPAPVNP